MEASIIILAALVIVNSGLLIWLLISSWRSRGPDPTARLDAALSQLRVELVSQQLDGLTALRESLDSATKVLNDRLAEGTGALDRRMGLFSEIENKLGELTTQTKNIETIGSNIQSLSDLLKPPQLRGGLGELLLDNLLSQILPPALYQMQYRFSSGERVDAIVRLGDRLLPIDSKFPLESYQRLMTNEDEATANEFARTLRKHVDDISQKYVRPEENTVGTAIMYIPSEAVYSRFVAEDGTDSLGYALSKGVIPSSPGHLYGFLASLIAVFQQTGLARVSGRLAETLRQISAGLERLGKAHDRIEGSLRSISSGLNRARSESSRMTAQLDKLHEPANDDGALIEAATTDPEGGLR